MPDASNSSQITVEDIDSSPGTALATAEDTQVSASDYRAAFVTVSAEKEALAEKLDQTEKRVRTVEILDELLEPMATKAFWFMCAYCAAVGALVAFHGFGFCEFALPESVLQFLVGSTATTVIGLVGMVLTGIFLGARKSGKD